MIAWLVGGLVSYYLSTYAPYFVPSIIGMAVAALLYYAASKLRGRWASDHALEPWPCWIAYTACGEDLALC